MSGLISFLPHHILTQLSFSSSCGAVRSAEGLACASRYMKHTALSALTRSFLHPVECIAFPHCFANPLDPHKTHGLVHRSLQSIVECYLSNLHCSNCPKLHSHECVCVCVCVCVCGSVKGCDYLPVRDANPVAEKRGINSHQRQIK